MILYVFLLWLSAIGLVLVVELCLMALKARPEVLPQEGAGALSGPDPLLVSRTGQTGSLILLALVLGLALGYLTESRLQPVRRLYLQLQSRYPSWYRRWPALYRELLLALGLGAMLQLPAGLTVLLAPRLWPVVVLSLSLSAGILIPVVWRLRGTLSEDRPEQPPKAVVHHFQPKYDLRTALWIGQIYLRILLPVFSLFCILTLPLALGYLNLGLTDTLLVLIALLAGSGLGWWANADSHFSLESFRSNLLQLGALVLLAAGFLILGLASGNVLLILSLGLFSGFLAGVY
ncbi:MAG: hypothetical protein IGS03_02405 [Candidatus Sericytochromatia bacterium]|nr:hypothetical protein [Candidatus Sericytochromatia bacterium]